MRGLARAALLAAALAAAAPARAQQPAAGEGPAGDGSVERAREAFLRGVALVKQQKWAEALVEFERSLAERPHAVTFYNAALCHRALGRPAQAVFALERALAGGDELPEPTRQEAQRLLDELRSRRSFVLLDLGVSAALTVDGQPTERLGEVWAQAPGPAGKGELPRGPSRLTIEPGTHELRVSREGHAPAVLRLTLAPGEQRSWRVELAPLAGLLVIDSKPPRARLRLNELPVGELPVTLERPAGPYRIEVTAPGRVPFQTEVTLRPGGRADVMAELREERTSLLRRWWFWAGIGAVVVGAAVTTYALTRPTEKADGGSLGWVVRP